MSVSRLLPRLDGGDFEGEGREGKELRAKAAKQVREEKEKEKEKEQQRLEKAEKRRRSSIDRNQASRCWSRPGPARTKLSRRKAAREASESLSVCSIDR